MLTRHIVMEQISFSNFLQTYRFQSLQTKIAIFLKLFIPISLNNETKHDICIRKHTNTHKHTHTQYLHITLVIIYIFSY